MTKIYEEKIKEEMFSLLNDLKKRENQDYEYIVDDYFKSMELAKKDEKKDQNNSNIK